MSNEAFNTENTLQRSWRWFGSGLAFVATALVAIGGAAPSRAQVTVYQDDFSGAGGPLNGAAVDIGGQTWTAGPVYLDDGTIGTVVDPDGPNGEAAWLPFTPVDGKIYTLSVDIENQFGDWIAVGFLPESPPGGDWTATDFSVRHSNCGGYAWVLTRNSTGNDQEGFNGPNTDNPAFAGDIAPTVTPVEIDIVLNTGSAAWTAEYFINGVSQGVYGVPGSASTDIGGVGFSRDRNATAGTGGIADNFLLIEEDAPPPAPTVYQEDFSGTGGLLNGVAPDVAPGAETWSANSFANDDGTINGSDEGSAILPFTPVVNMIYTLSMEVFTPVGCDRWVALGFCRDPLGSPGASTYNDRFSNEAEGKSWMLIREHATNQDQDVEVFAGLRTAGPIADNNAAFTFGVWHTLTIILDTSGDGSTFTADFLIDGGSVVGGPQVISTLSDINYVGFSYDNETTTPPMVDNFQLTSQEATPPGAWDGDVNDLWSVPANWTNDTLPNFFGFTDVLYFDVPNGVATTLLNDITDAEIQGISFVSGAPAYTLSGNALAISSAVTNNSAQTQEITFDMSSSGSLTANASAGPLILSGVITTASGLAKAGNSPLYLESANNIGGPVTFDGDGNIVMTASGALGDPNSTVQLNAYFNGGVNSSLEFDGGVTQGKICMVYTRTDVDPAHIIATSGANTMNGEIRNVSGGDRITLHAEQGASLDVNADFFTDEGMGTDLVRCTGNGTITLNGQFNDTPDQGLGVLKADGILGAAYLNGTKMYHGDTIAESGLLAFVDAASTNPAPNSTLFQCAADGVLDFSGLSGGGIVLLAGQTLAGDGSVVGPVAAPAGSAIAPGVDGTGTLEIEDLVLEADAGLTIEVGASGNDRINIAAGGSLIGPTSGTVNITVEDPGDIADGDYIIMDWSAASTVDIQLADFFTEAGTLTIVNGNQLQLTIVLESMAEVLISDTGNNVVLKHNVSQFGTWIPDPVQPVFAGPNCCPPWVLEAPVGLAKDSAGNVYMAEGLTNLEDRVMMLDSSGNYLDTIAEVASSPDLDFSGTPAYLAVDPTDSYLFMSIAEPNSTATDPTLEDVIYRIDLSRVNPPEVYIPTTDVGGTYVLQDPQGLAFGPQGYLYVANNLDPAGSPDQGSRILRFDVSGATGVFAGVLTDEHRDTKGLFFDAYLGRLLVSLNALNDIWAYSDLTLDYVAEGDPSFAYVYNMEVAEDYPNVIFASGNVYFTDITNDVVRRVAAVDSAPVALGTSAGLVDPRGLLVLSEIDAFDFDNDGDVDFADGEVFMGLMAGPDVTTPPPGVSISDFHRADIDNDGDADAKDYWALMRRVTD